MSKVLISIKPYYYYLVGEGIKKVDIRKTIPKAKDWDKEVLFYMTNDEKSFAQIPKEFQAKYRKHFGKVGMQIICDNITNLFCEFKYNDCYQVIYTLDNYNSDDKHRYWIPIWDNEDNHNWDKQLAPSCVKIEELNKYMENVDKQFYAWHISNLVIYDKPKKLSKFFAKCNIPEKKCKCCDNCYEMEDSYGRYFAAKKLTRPPQSWQYINKT